MQRGACARSSPSLLLSSIFESSVSLTWFVFAKISFAYAFYDTKPFADEFCLKNRRKGATLFGVNKVRCERDFYESVRTKIAYIIRKIIGLRRYTFETRELKTNYFKIPVPTRKSAEGSAYGSANESSMNRRKNRGASNRSPRTRGIPTEGVYNNPHFMHAATRLIGNVVRIQTASGKVWEGVFRTFSSQLDIVLEVAACVDNPDSTNATLLANSLVDKLIFKACDIISMDAKDVDLEFATRDTFKTDTAISARTNGQHIRTEEKELEPWDPPVGVNGGDTSLELEPGANGWDAMDMFRKNEEIYGVQSTYDNSLTGYTVQLQKSDTPDYREREALAQQLANEIESQPAYKQRIEMENGDEETLYAAVHRPNQENIYSKQPSEQQNNSSSGKYVPPAKRKNPTSGKLMRSTPPPSQSGSTQTTPSPKGNPPPLSYPTQHPSPNQQPQHPSPNQHSQPPPQQQQHREPPVALRDAPPPVMHQSMHQPPPPPPPQTMPPPVVTIPNHGGGRPHSHTPPHPAYGAQMQQARGGGVGGGGGGGVGQGMPPSLQTSNGGHKAGGQQMNGEMKPPPSSMQQQTQGGGLSRPPRNMYAASPNSAPPPMMVAPSMYQDVQGGPKQDSMNCVPGRHRDDVKELHKFSQEFKLAPHISEQTLQPPPPNQMPPEQMGPPPSIVQKSHPAQQSTPPQQQQPPPNIQQQQQPQQSVSPQQDAMDKVTNTLKQSTLNPNAKEFVLNPTAKPFTPRSPSTPTASRPHTPQTPSNPYVPPVLSGPPGQPQMPMMMSMGYMMTSQPQYQPQPQNNRFRKLPVGQIRADMTQMQVAAATGQPLLAPAPIPQFQIYQGLNPQTAYQQMHAVRMYESPPQLQYIQSNPSNAPSPAQPPPYTPGGQGPPPQPQQYPAAPPQGHPQFQMMCPIIQTQPAAMMQASMHYLQQPPPGGAPIQVIMPHPQQQHGPTP
ncbi:hypothetical protein Trydic_g21810 [Trypoxylus dichotomus]